MSDLRIGDSVIFQGETFVVSGVSPMSVIPQRVYLDDAETGELLEVLIEDLEREEAA